VLAVLYDLGSLTSADPFPLPVLDRLGTLLGAHRTGYGEFSIGDGGRSYSTMYVLQNHTEPAWLAETLARLWHQDPITCRVHARSVEPMAFSDRVSMLAFHRLLRPGTLGPETTRARPTRTAPSPPRALAQPVERPRLSSRVGANRARARNPPDGRGRRD
jgi:hypothetical protein